LAKAKLPEQSREVFREAVRNGQEFLVIPLDTGSTGSRENINIHCTGGVSTQPSGDQIVQILRNGGLQASKVGAVTVEGWTRDLLKVEFFPDFDTYQTYILKGPCFYVMTLTAGMNRTSAVDDFRTFLSMLRISPSER